VTVPVVKGKALQLIHPIPVDVVIEKVVLQMQEPVRFVGFQTHCNGDMHRQVVLPMFEPILLVMLVQFTQVLLMFAVILVIQLQVLAF
jgi:hypothetical protein